MSKFSKLGILFLLCTLTFSCKDFQSNDLVFSSKEWKESDFRVRGRMYSSLLNQKLLTGKTRSEVIEILGKADEEYKDSIKYAIDLGSIFERCIQRYFLMITFDEQTQKVKDTEIIDS
jgi:hypothetical protein